MEVEKINVATGEVLCCYESAAEAGRITRIDRSSIHKVCKGSVLTAGGFFWRFKGSNATQPRAPAPKPNLGVAKKVEQLDSTGTVLRCHDSMSDAESYTGIGRHQISKVCEEKKLTAGGFFWRYKGSNAKAPSFEYKEYVRITNTGVAKEVEQLDSTTGMVLQCFASTAEAKRKTGVDDANISKVCKGVQLTAGGFFWRFKGSNVTQPRPSLSHGGAPKEVEQISVDTGAVICCFVSIADAERKTGTCESTIRQVCRGKKRKAGECFWRYKECEVTGITAFYSATEALASLSPN
tara:strand:+ start:1162 stop:2043 length:882 start_codon:yes stop_codon:yes gene_type:complete